jgi:hypothetical protein
MSSIEERVTTLRERATDTHTLAAHADRDVAEFREEIRAQTKLLNATRLDMIKLRENEAEHYGELRAGISQIVRMLEGLTGPS